jgi:hypothetical protein
MRSIRLIARHLSMPAFTARIANARTISLDRFAAEPRDIPS